jgi:hypothetical protein
MSYGGGCRTHEPALRDSSLLHSINAMCGKIGIHKVQNGNIGSKGCPGTLLLQSIAASRKLKILGIDL